MAGGPQHVSRDEPDVLDGRSHAARRLAQQVALALTGLVAPPVLRTGRVRLQGKVPNGQWFQANPGQLWTVTASSARIDGEDLGCPGPLPEQARLGDLWLPRRSLFFIGEAFFEAFDPARHWSPRYASVA